MKVKVLFLVLGTVLVSLLCGGCFGGRTVPSSYYRLGAEPVAVRDAVRLPEIIGLRVELPDYLRCREIVETGRGNLMTIRKNARWGHSLSEGIRDSLSCRLGFLNDGGKCPAMSGDRTPWDTMRLDYRFWKFAGDGRGSLKVQGVCKITFPLCEETARTSRFRFDFAVPYEENSTAALVAAHDQAVARLTEETALHLKAWLVKRNAAR